MFTAPRKLAILMGSFLTAVCPSFAQTEMPKDREAAPASPRSIAVTSESAPPLTDCGQPCPPTCADALPTDCGLSKHFPRPKIILHQQAPEVIFRRVPTTNVRLPGPTNCVTCPTTGSQGAPQFTTPSNTTPSNAVPMATATTTTMAYTAVPVVSYQTQVVPTISYQYRLTPVQQNLLVPQVATQNAFVGVQQAQPAFFNQSFTAQTQGVGIGAVAIEELIRALLANRTDSNLQDLLNALLRRSGGQACPEEMYQELIRQLRALNDRLSAGGGTPEEKKSVNDKVLDTLGRITNVLDKLSAQVDEHERILKELQSKKQ